MEENTQLSEILLELETQTRTLQGMAGAPGTASGGKSPLSKAVDSTVVVVSKYNQEVKKATKAEAEAVKQTNEFGKVLGILTDTTNGLEKNFERTKHAAAGAANAMGRDFVGSIRRSLSSNQRSAAQFGSTLETTGSALGSGFNTLLRAANPASKMLFGLGAAGKVAIAELFKLGKAAIDQQQQMFDAYQGLSKVGMSAGGDLNALLNIIHTAGFSLAQAETVAKSFSAHSQTVAAFGDTAADGAKNMAALSGELINSDMGRRLREMGYQREELMDIVMQYATTQMATGKLQQMTTRQQATAVYKYVQELDTATRLTGVSNADLLKQEERRRADERVSAARAMRPDEYNQMKPLFDMLASLDPQLLQGVEHIFAGQGAITSPEARAAIMQIPEIRKVMSDMLSGGDSLTAVQSVVGSLERTVGPNGRFTRVMSVAGEIQGIGRAGAQREFITRLKTAKSMEEIQAVLKDQKETTTGAAQAMVNVDDSLIKLQQNSDKLVNRLGFSTVAVDGFTTALSAGAEALNDILYTPGKNFGGTTVGGQTPPPSPRDGAGLQAQITGRSSDAAQRVQSINGATEPTGIRGVPGAQLDSTAPTGDVTSRLLDYIGRKESNGNYNILVGGRTEPNLSNMTIAEVLAYQSSMLANGHESTAVGKYQIINKTLKGLVANGAANLNDKFSATTQDKLGIALMKGRGLESYKSGRLSAGAFADNLAKEWASLPTASGSSYYAGVGSNKAGGSRDDFMKIFGSGFQRGGIATGPESGHVQLLHGTEAVIPLPDGKSIPINTSSIDSKIDAMSAMLSRAGPQNSYSSNMKANNAEIIMTQRAITEAEAPAKIEAIIEGIERTMGRRLEDLVDSVRKGNDINNKILRMSQ